MKNYIYFRITIVTIFLLLIFTKLYGQSWENLPGKASEISVGGDTVDIVWTIGQNKSAYKWNENSFTWQTYGGKADDLAVTYNGIPWVINNKKVYRLRGQAWQNIPGKLIDIASGGNQVWGIGDSKIVYMWDENAYSWQSYGGKAEVIAVDNTGRPWVINGNKIYRLRGQVWQNIPGNAKDIAAGGGEIWCIGDNDEAYKWNEDAFTWQTFSGKSSKIAVGASGTPYVLSRRGDKIYRLRGWK